MVDPSAYPAGVQDLYWNAAFEIPASFDPDLRGAWHSLAVSVSPSDGGVTAYLDGEVSLSFPASACHVAEPVAHLPFCARPVHLVSSRKHTDAPSEWRGSSWRRPNP
jgi:hypothetical protein